VRPACMTEHPTAPPRAKARSPSPAPPGGLRLPVDSSLFFKLVRVVNLTARPFVETLGRDHQLSLNEWRAMLVLASHPGVAASEVADLTGLDKMSVSRAIAALARHGRVLKQGDSADGRRTRLWLSDGGRGLFETIGHQAAQREAQLFSGISAGEQDRLGRSIDKLIAALRTPEGGA
jgi:DNA-binding MarR family transcriptional regulator